MNIVNFYVLYIGAVYSLGAHSLVLKALHTTLILMIGALNVDVYGIGAHAQC